MTTLQSNEAVAIVLISSNEVVSHYLEEEPRKLKQVSFHTAVTVCNSDTDSEWEGDDSSSQVEKRVHFCGIVIERSIESHWLYSQEERDCCWYTPDDRAAMRADVERVVARIDSGEPLDEQGGQDSYRGLNAWTIEGGRMVQANIAAVWDAVLDEQYEQWKAGECNDEWISRVSQEESIVCGQAAIYVAQEDEKQADNVEEFL